MCENGGFSLSRSHIYVFLYPYNVSIFLCISLELLWVVFVIVPAFNILCWYYLMSYYNTVKPH